MSEDKFPSKNTDNGDQAFVKKVRDSLDESVDSLDEITRNKLAIARREALANKIPKRSHAHWWITAPGALASLLIITLVFQQPESEIPPAALLQDLELLMLQEELELLEALENGSINGLDDESNPLLEPYSES